ncbi:MAG: hypothetical protein K1X86_02900 [Ignavibacteria bacterium]|nr:hypothetical protein [Ignavibacteria bacterium]
MKKFFIIIFSLAAASVFSQQGWFFLNPTPTANIIIDVKMFDENTGICVGTNEILRTTDTGANWTRTSNPWASINTSLSMINNSTGYMSIDSNTI